MIDDYLSPVFFDVDGKPRRNKYVDPVEQRNLNLENEIRSLKFEIECLKADVEFMKRINLFKQNGLDYCFVDVDDKILEEVKNDRK